ncbi:MAG: hypothetical protein ACOCZD_01340 [Haloferacaceae archaeon]
MQRRTVAIYVAFFLLVGIASYGLIATADAPEVQLEDPDFALAEGDEFEVGGQVYNATDVTRNEEEDEMGETEVSYEATVEWTVEDVEQSESWENGTEIAYDDAEYEVVAEENASDFLLREVIDREALLEDDPAADNETIERDGEEYVVIEEDGETRLVPADDYFPDPREERFETEDTMEYDNRTVTVDAVEEATVTVVWTTDETESTSLGEGEETTFGDTTYLAHFSGGEDNLRLELTSDVGNYEAELDRIDRHEQRITGLWYVVALAGVTIAVLVGMAFLPSRY